MNSVIKKRSTIVLFYLVLIIVLSSCGKKTGRVDLVKDVLLNHDYVAVNHDEFEKYSENREERVYTLYDNREIDAGIKQYKEKEAIQFYSSGMFGGVCEEWSSIDGAKEWYYSQSGNDRVYRFPVDIVNCEIRELTSEDKSIWISYVINPNPENHYAYVDVLDNRVVLRLWANIDDSESVTMMKEMLDKLNYSKHLSAFYAEIEESKLK